MSWIKDQAAKASNIQLTEADHARASAAKPGGPRTAPGQLMNLQATAAAQREEIERLKVALQGAAKVKLPVSRLHEVPHRRRKLTVEQYGELKANLEKYPLSTPVSVRRRQTVTGTSSRETIVSLSIESSDVRKLKLSS